MQGEKIEKMRCFFVEGVWGKALKGGVDIRKLALSTTQAIQQST